MEENMSNDKLSNEAIENNSQTKSVYNMIQLINICQTI